MGVNIRGLFNHGQIDIRIGNERETKVQRYYVKR